MLPRRGVVRGGGDADPHRGLGLLDTIFSSPCPDAYNIHGGGRPLPCRRDSTRRGLQRKQRGRGNVDVCIRVADGTAATTAAAAGVGGGGVREAESVVESE